MVGKLVGEGAGDGVVGATLGFADELCVVVGTLLGATVGTLLGATVGTLLGLAAGTIDKDTEAVTLTLGFGREEGTGAELADGHGFEELLEGPRESLAEAGRVDVCLGVGAIAGEFVLGGATAGELVLGGNVAGELSTELGEESAGAAVPSNDGAEEEFGAGSAAASPNAGAWDVAALEAGGTGSG